MRALLDTNVLLWWLSDHPSLTKKHREVISDGSNDIFVSAITLAEISIKVSLGKLVAPDDLTQICVDEGFELLPLLPPHADLLRTLPWHHRDPFDRMLISQAMVENLTFLSVDKACEKYPMAHI